MNSITLPGLIDPHVHMRDPGQTHKEDFFTGTSAALAGGFTTILDMPNNAVPVTTEAQLTTKASIAKQGTVCGIGFYFGSLGDNLGEFQKVSGEVFGLKVYLNVTTGNFIIDKDKLVEIYRAWPEGKPILLHAEDDVSDLVRSVLRKVPKATHMCHVSSRKELEFVIAAKEEGLPVTCGATPHHLFLTDKDAARLGPYGHMKPYLKSQKDQDFLWQHIDAIDIIESDHAPHTKAEKESAQPPFGVPGLETTLPLLLTAQQEGRITHAQLVNLLHDNAQKLFRIPPDEGTRIEVDMSEYDISNESLKTKCDWTPFAGRRVVGKTHKAFIRDRLVYSEGKILAAPGSGHVITPL